MSNLKTLRNHKEGTSPEELLDRARHELKFKKLMILGIGEEGETHILFSHANYEFIAYSILELMSYYNAQGRWDAAD